MFQLPLLPLLTASVIVAVLGVSGFLISTSSPPSDASIRIEPTQGTTVVGDIFTVSIMVDASVPVNVFRGALIFDAKELEVKRIDYNTSIANLWAEEPWYSNGDGTITFTGGTTQAGGFIGTGSLITIEFFAKQAGTAHINMTEAQILKHDGLGTAVPLTTPIEALFAVNEFTVTQKTALETSAKSTDIVIRPETTTDLNADGKQTIADVSIFMSDVMTQNLRSDFNQDGSITFKDLSILTWK